MDDVSKIEITKGGDYKSSGLAGCVNFLTTSQAQDERLSSAAERGSFGLETYSVNLTQNYPVKMNLGLKESYVKGAFQFLRSSRFASGPTK